MGNVELSVASFRQMCGRAGRMGLDAEVKLFLSLSISIYFFISLCFLLSK